MKKDLLTIEYVTSGLWANMKKKKKHNMGSFLLLKPNSARCSANLEKARSFSVLKHVLQVKRGCGGAGKQSGG